MIDLAHAWNLLDGEVEPGQAVELPVEAALSAIAARAIRSTVQLPPFHNSAMDGYAVRSADTELASEANVVRLALRAQTFAGDAPADAIEPGTAVRIMTGAPLPSGADAVVQLEHARLRADVVELRAPAGSGRHVRRAGEDVTPGDVLVDAGVHIDAGHIGLLSAAGVTHVHAARRPRVGLVVTGSELRTPDNALGPGEIFDANGPVLRALVTASGCMLHDGGIVSDDADALRAAIHAASAHSDVLIISGGVSVGTRDHVKRVLELLGAERLFWRVRMKPGKPLLCARLPTGCLVFGLPGNPISALAGWTLFVEPAIRRLSGDRRPFGPHDLPARITHDEHGDEARTRMATASIHVDEQGVRHATLTRTQGSAMLRSMADGTCFAHIEQQSNLRAGDVISTYAW